VKIFSGHTYGLCVIGVLCVFFVGVGIYGLLMQNTPQVVLTEDGFVPKTLSIVEGQTVIFVSTLDRPYWPASSVHPTHSIYPDFDPKKPIPPGTTWSFTFTQQGTWSYHDHLKPIHTGSIEVKGKGDKKSHVWGDSCVSLQGSEKLQCFEQTLEKVLVRNGLHAAFDYFLSIYNQDPDVPSVCHGWAHRLGEVEYEAYKNGNEVSLRPESAFCSYGYFHGFISAMVRDTQSLQSALTFCDAAIAKEQDGLLNLRNNCLHGVGHSITTLYQENSDYWSDFEKIMRSGFGECEKLYQDSLDQNICFDGMFHELHLSIMQETYGMSKDEYLNSEDQFYYCRNLEDRYKESCYFDFATLWPYFFNDDKDAAMEFFLSSIENKEAHAPRAMITFARSFIESDISLGDFSGSVGACAIAPETLSDECLTGMVLGFIEYAVPGNAHEEGFSFCRTYYISNKKEQCLTVMIGALRWNYTRENFKRACDSLLLSERVAACAG